MTVKPFSPVLAMLISTGRFSSGARRLAEKAGLIVISGWQLSVFLADRGIGMVEANGVHSFSENEFLSWLTSD